MVLSAEPSPTRSGRLIVISGASGSGKSTLVDRLLADGRHRLKRSISATTRSPRPGEVAGIDYLFVTREQFEADRAAGRFLESAEVHGHLYGTPRGPIEADLDRGTCVVLVIDVQGGKAVRDQVPAALLIFIQAPASDILERRLRARGTDDDATIRRRLANAITENAQADRYDHQIINDDFDAAVAALTDILTRNHCGA